MVFFSTAKIFGLYPQKGVLQPGSDADLVIIDPTIRFTIANSNPLLNVDYSMYEGRTGSGVPVITMQRGKILYKNGKLIGKAGQGRYLSAQPNPKS